MISSSGSSPEPYTVPKITPLFTGLADGVGLCMGIGVGGDEIVDAERNEASDLKSRSKKIVHLGKSFHIFFEDIMLRFPH